jgi:hypothetical protein
MNDLWTIINVLAQLSMAVLILYVTWLVIRGFMLSDHSEGDKHHD